MSAADKAADAITAGRKAALALTAVSDKILDMTDTIMGNAVSAHRGGELSPERAVVAWGKIDALWGLKEWLEDEVRAGDAASVAQAAARTGHAS